MPPKEKGVFHGRRGKRKFTRNARTGAQQKNSSTRRLYDAAANEGGVPPPPQAHPAESTIEEVVSRRATRRRTRAELISAIKISDKNKRCAEDALAREQKKRERSDKHAASTSSAVLVAREATREARAVAKRSEAALRRTELALEAERDRKVEVVNAAVKEAVVSRLLFLIGFILSLKYSA